MPIGIDDVVGGLLVSGLASFLGKIGKSVSAHVLKEPDANVDLENFVSEAAEVVSEEFQWQGPGRLEEVCLFLASPEAELSLFGMFGVSLLKEGALDTVNASKASFTKSLAQYIGESEAEVKIHAGHLFDQLSASCEILLSDAVARGLLSAHDIKSDYRYKVVMDGLASIDKRLELLSSRNSTNVPEILAFEKQFRGQVALRHGHLIPAHFDSANRLPIEKFYVPPTLEISTSESEGDSPDVKDVGLSIFSRVHRSVILGNPGGGKSTLASFLSHQLATRYDDRLYCNRKLTPFHVVLRDYGSAKRERSYSLLEFIEHTCNSTYQIKPPEGALKYLLLNGRGLVVLDGLDELIDTSTRLEVTRDVEAFCNLFSEVPVVVTSREVGYAQAPLDSERFRIIRLSPMDDEQIEKYVSNWFNANIDLTPSEQETLAETFLLESESVRDLCSNPLMLSLMCTIYKGERYIPRNRPDVYEKCALMLFERWDRSRGIEVALPFEAHIRPAMMFLADWIYRDPQLQSGVTESLLIERAAEYLSQRRFDDVDEAKHAARAFIDYCTGRAWVFSDTGTTESGERLFQFTHRTFMEYFAASYLVRTNATPAKLGKVLCPRIVKGEWDVIAQLAFQIQNKNVEGAGDSLISILLKQSLTRKKGVWNLLGFSARCLEFLVVSPTTARMVTEFGLERALSELTKAANGLNAPARHPWNGFAEALINSAPENWPAVKGALGEPLAAAIDQTTDITRSVVACEMLLRIERSKLRSEKEIQDFSTRIFERCSDRVEAICQSEFLIPVLRFLYGRVGLETLIKDFGIDAIFKAPHSLLTKTQYFSPVEGMLVALNGPNWDEHVIEFRLGELERLSDILITMDIPYFQHGPDLDRELGGFGSGECPDITPGAAHAVLVLLGAYAEAEELPTEIRELIESEPANSSSVRANIYRVIKLYVDGAEYSESEAIISEIELPPGCLDAIQSWLRREVRYCVA